MLVSTDQNNILESSRSACHNSTTKSGVPFMAQIFISHSSKDRQSVDFLSKAFASTKVKGVFEEFEAILKGPANAERIAQDIRESNAVFVLLGLNVEALRHTRDWVGWENGFAAAEARKTNKDIWVLEPISEMDGLTVVIPYLRHYVCFNPTDEHWQGYLTQIIESYDDSHFLKAALVGGVGGGVGAGLASSGKGKDGKVGIGFSWGSAWGSSLLPSTLQGGQRASRSAVPSAGRFTAST